MNNRWLMLVAGVWIQITTGSSYVFGVYSESLKRALGFSQTQLDTLALVKGIGANVGIHTGLLYLVVPPWIVLALGAAHNLFGYLMLYLAGTHRVQADFWQICLFMAIAGNAQTYFNTAVVVTAVTNFPASRGTVIGLMKGCLGLSGAVLTFFYQSLLHPPDQDSQISYTLFAALVPTLTSLLLMYFIQTIPAAAATTAHPDPHESSYLSSISATAVALAFGLIPVTIVNMSHVFRLISCILLLLSLTLPLVIALKAGISESKNAARLEEQESLLGESSSGAAELDIKDSQRLHGNESDSPPTLGQEYTLMQAFTSLEFWLLVLAVSCGMGSGLTVINNVNQIGLSLGYSSRNISVTVSLLSVWNFLGRFLAGAVSDYYLRTKGFPRPLFISLALGALSLGHLMIAIAFPGALFVGTVVVGLCYGAQWSLMPATVSEIFGLRQFGTLFNTIAVASPIGEYLLSVRVAGYVYDEEARRQHSTTLSCLGPECFRLTFLILSGICALGCVCTGLMIQRTKRYYKQVHVKVYLKK